MFSGLVPSSKIRLMQRACGIKERLRNRGLKSIILLLQRMLLNVLFTEPVFVLELCLLDYPGLEKLDNNTQGVVLSLVFNYGPHAKQLDGLHAPIKAHNIRGILEHAAKTAGRCFKCQVLFVGESWNVRLPELVVQNKVPKPPRKQDYFD